MKLPELIKKGLERCGGLDGDCENCPYDDRTIYCSDRLMRDALAYIQQLEAGIDHAEKVARECAKSISENLDKLQAKLFQLESDNECKQKRIEELESRLAQVERERDAALKEWKRTKMDSEGMCWTCKHGKNTGIGSCRCVSPFPCDEGEEWEWRGVCEENTEEG